MKLSKFDIKYKYKTEYITEKPDQRAMQDIPLHQVMYEYKSGINDSFNLYIQNMIDNEEYSPKVQKHNLSAWITQAIK